MPRFSVKSLLIATAVIALLMLTFVPDVFVKAIGEQFRKCLLLLIVLAAGFAVIYFRGRRQAFWAGVLLMMLILQIVPGDFVPNLSNVAANVRSYLMVRVGLPENPTIYSFEQNLHVALVLALSAVGGYIAAYIYDQSQQDKDG